MAFTIRLAGFLLFFCCYLIHLPSAVLVLQSNSYQQKNQQKSGFWVKGLGDGLCMLSPDVLEAGFLEGWGLGSAIGQF